MDVQIYSRKEIEKRIQAEFPPHTAVISFTIRLGSAATTKDRWITKASPICCCRWPYLILIKKSCRITA